MMCTPSTSVFMHSLVILIGGRRRVLCSLCYYEKPHERILHGEDADLT